MAANVVHYFHVEYHFKPSSLTWISSENFNNSSNCVVLWFLKGLEQKNIRLSGKTNNPVRNGMRDLFIFWGKALILQR